MDRVYSGWLTKSPPENRMRGFLKSHWRRRYFVLYAAPTQSDIFPPTRTAILEYYDSERTANKKGAIELKYCEELLDHLDSGFYKHLFALKICRSDQSRTYYMAADSEAEMNAWVSHLAAALGFGVGDTDPVILPISDPVPQVSRSNGVHSVPHSQPSSSVTSWSSSPPNVNIISTDSGNSSCTSPVVTSPAPIKIVKITSNRNGPSDSSAPADTASQDVYDRPPPSLTPKKSKLCPRPNEFLGMEVTDSPASETDEEVYNVPRARFDSETDRSSGATADADADADESEYDFPPLKGEARVPSSQSNDDVYDFPAPLPLGPVYTNPVPAPKPHTQSMKYHGYINAPAGIMKSASTVSDMQFANKPRPIAAMRHDDLNRNRMNLAEESDAAGFSDYANCGEPDFDPRISVSARTRSFRSRSRDQN